MKGDQKKEGKQSFIAEARREQIIEAAIKTLDEIGYVRTSLAKIAEKARISTGLISYHFSDKEDLMNSVLLYLVEKSFHYISTKVEQKDKASEKLVTFIEANLAYQASHHTNNIALIEIVFNARTPENIPYYMLAEEDEDQLYCLLQKILKYGQETKEFSVFDPLVVSMMIQGAINEMMLTTEKKIDLELYSKELITMVMRIVK